MKKSKVIRRPFPMIEQTGSGAAGGTNTSTFQPAVGPGGSASTSGAFPGAETKAKRRKKRRVNDAISKAVAFYDRVKKSSVKGK